MYLELKRSANMIHLNFTSMIETHLLLEENKQFQQRNEKLCLMYHKKVILMIL